MVTLRKQFSHTHTHTHTHTLHLSPVPTLIIASDLHSLFLLILFLFSLSHPFCHPFFSSSSHLPSFCLMFTLFLFHLLLGCYVHTEWRGTFCVRIILSSLTPFSSLSYPSLLSFLLLPYPSLLYFFSLSFSSLLVFLLLSYPSLLYFLLFAPLFLLLAFFLHVFFFCREPSETSLPEEVHCGYSH